MVRDRREHAGPRGPRPRDELSSPRARRPAALVGAAGLAALAWAAAPASETGGQAGGETGAPGPGARLHVEGPPPGHTGGFGEPTCAACHVGSPLNEPGSTLELLGLGGTYRPGESYELTVRLLSFDMLAAGFQAAIRRADGPRAGRSAGTLRPRDARVAVVPSEDGRVRYAQHARQGTPADGERAEWRLDWVAPEEGGRLALHVAANSGNGDNSPLDDLVYTLSASLLPEGR